MFVPSGDFFYFLFFFYFYFFFYFFFIFIFIFIFFILFWQGLGGYLFRGEEEEGRVTALYVHTYILVKGPSTFLSGTVAFVIHLLVPST